MTAHGRRCPFEDEYDASEESPTTHFISVFLVAWMLDILKRGFYHVLTWIQNFTKPERYSKIALDAGLSV